MDVKTFCQRIYDGLKVLFLCSFDIHAIIQIRLRQNLRCTALTHKAKHTPVNISQIVILHNACQDKICLVLISFYRHTMAQYLGE